jgi:hypothetical protein
VSTRAVVVAGLVAALVWLDPAKFEDPHAWKR